MDAKACRDDFTCISSRGCSVVDYCLVPAEELDSITNFRVKTMYQCEAALCCNEEGYRCLTTLFLLGTW